MNIIRDDESGLSVVVSRGVIPDGSDYEQEFHRQWDVLRPQMGEIAQSEFQHVKAGPDGKINGLEVETTFDRNGQRLWQNSWPCRRQQTDTDDFYPLGLKSLYGRGRGALERTEAKSDAKRQPECVRHER